MSENKYVCDLCGLPVEISGFELMTEKGKKRFCCEGCKGIYQMLHENLFLTESKES
jgi:Putative metal-binding domain of cation transport ATPase